MAKTINTWAEARYVVTLTEAGTVWGVVDGEEVVLVTREAPGQASFYAVSEQTIVSDDNAMVFRTSSASGGGSSAEEVEELVAGMLATALAEHAATTANMTALGHVKTGSVGITLENGKLRVKFRTSHSGFEADSNNAVYVNTGTDSHPTHATIAPVGTDTAGKLCVPALTSELIALLEVLLANKDALLSQIGASEAEAAAISEAAEAMAIAEAEEAAAAADEAAEVDATADMAL